jgi:hypothetical protein
MTHPWSSFPVCISPADRIVQDARVLILSIHGATAKDTAMHIHGVPQENIVCVVWMTYEFLVDSSPCVRDERLEALLIPLVQDVTGLWQNKIVANDSWVVQKICTWNC